MRDIQAPLNMAGTPFHIRCPACGQLFMTYVDHPQMAQACPQCHFNGLRGQFPPASDAPPPRRESKRFAPTTSSLQPAAWEIQQYGPIGSAAVQPPFQPSPAPSPPPPASPGTADWAAVQAYQEMMAARLQAAQQPAPPPSAPRPPPDWAPMKPSNLPKLTPWPGLEPAADNETALEKWQASGRRRGIPWRWLLATLVIVGLIVTLVLERKNTNAVMSRLAIEARAAEAQAKSAAVVDPSEGTIAKAIPVDEKPTPRECMLSSAQSEAIARPLVERLFAATTDADRLACVAFPSKNADSVADFFTRHRDIHLKALNGITKLVLCLPATSPQPIFDITTSLSNDTSGILRLITSNDGELKLDWPLLHDSLDGSFAAYQKQKPDALPQWISLGLRRNYGFGEAPELREVNSFFDMQGYGNGVDKAVVQVVKNSSTGRAMDQGLAWGELFIVRVLVGWQTFNGVPRLTVINAVMDDTGNGS